MLGTPTSCLRSFSCSEPYRVLSQFRKQQANIELQRSSSSNSWTNEGTIRNLQRKNHRAGISETQKTLIEHLYRKTNSNKPKKKPERITLAQRCNYKGPKTGVNGNCSLNYLDQPYHFQGRMRLPHLDASSGRPWIQVLDINGDDKMTIQENQIHT